MSEKPDYDLIGFIMAGEYRKKVLLALTKGISTPKMLSRMLGIEIRTISRALKELSDKGLVECATPERKKGRLYTVTKKGEEIVDYIMKEMHK